MPVEATRLYVVVGIDYFVSYEMELKSVALILIIN